MAFTRSVLDVVVLMKRFGTTTTHDVSRSRGVMELLGRPVWIGIVADDFEKERAFYRDVLGFEETREREGYVWFRAGDATLELAQQNYHHRETRRAGTAVGFRVDDVDAARAELVSRGAEPLTEIQGGLKAGARWCYFRDPEGNTFQITQELG
ncbi:MAG: VOC family protein [Actinomycetota bacterium]